MRFFLLICLIFFSFLLKAQKATFKVEKNDTEETVKLYSMYAKDSVSLFRNYTFQNVVFISSNKDYQYILYPSPEYARFCRVIYYGQANMYNIDRVYHKKLNEIKFIVVRLENNDTLKIKDFVLPVVDAKLPTVLIGGVYLDYDYELDNSTNRNFFLTNRSLEIYDESCNFEYKILSFSLRKIQSEEIITSNSNMITDEMLQIISNIKSGEEIRFENVLYTHDNTTPNVAPTLRVRIE
jgi:hypothetical protein